MPARGRRSPASSVAAWWLAACRPAAAASSLAWRAITRPTFANNTITAANAGAVRTYTTGGMNALPSATAANLYADILQGPANQTTFGANSVYDASTQMLFVTAPPVDHSSGGAVDVYVNEGLYWSLLETLKAPSGDSYVQLAMPWPRMATPWSSGRRRAICRKTAWSWFTRSLPPPCPS